VPVQYSYTSTPPMGCTACTEPQCLYSRATPLLPLWAVQPVQSLSACTMVHFTFTLVGFRERIGPHQQACFFQNNCDYIIIIYMVTKHGLESGTDIVTEPT